MPTPRAGEGRDDFVSRCIPIVLEDGTAQDQDQAVAVCNSMWEDGMEKAETAFACYDEQLSDADIDAITTAFLEQ